MLANLQAAPEITNEQLLQAIADGGSHNTTVLVMALMLAMAAMKILDRVLGRFWPGASSTGDDTRCAGPCEFAEHDRAQIQQLYDWHARFGTDGKPVWYNTHDPELLKSIAASLHTVAETQRDTLRIVERLDRRLDTIHPQ